MKIDKLITGMFMTFALTSGNASADAESISQGQDLNDEHCVKCHGNEVFTRKDRKVTSLQKLSAQVQRCDSNLGLKLFDDELDSISEFLNSAYYKF